jgi:hypothetical protein
MRPWAVAALLPFVAACQTPRVAARADGKVVHVTVAGEPFAAVHCGANPRPFVFPVVAPGGVQVTRGYPIAPREGDATDHPHHVSLWFAHGAVSGVDFWHGSARRERQALVDGPDVTNVADGVRVECELEWLVDASTLVCTELRSWTFRDDPANGTRTIDFETVLRPATTPLVFGDTKEGTFAMRLRAALCAEGPGAVGTLVDSSGRQGREVWGQRSRWIAAGGTVEGKQVGVAMFDHPGNHAHPTWWHARTYGLLAANPFGAHDFAKAPPGGGQLTVAPGNELRLRYRVLLHGTAWDRARIDAAYAQWVAATGS